MNSWNLKYFYKINRDKLEPKRSSRFGLGFLAKGMGIFLTLLPALGSLFHLLGYLVQSQYDDFLPYIIVSYFVMFVFVSLRFAPL